jgi:hypothetical protein
LILVSNIRTTNLAILKNGSLPTLIYEESIRDGLMTILDRETGALFGKLAQFTANV